MTFPNQLNPMSKHVLHHFDDEIAQLRQTVQHFGEEIIELWGFNHEALIDGNLQLASDAIAKTSRCWRDYLEIEQKAVALLAKEQPVAVDLRFAVTTIKMAYELNNIVDLGHEMARLILALYFPRQGVPGAWLIADLTDLDLQIYHAIDGLLDAYKSRDSKFAAELFGNIVAIENSIRGAMAQLIMFIQDHENKISSALTILQMMKALESCCMSCKSVAQYCIYINEGIDISA